MVCSVERVVKTVPRSRGSSGGSNARITPRSGARAAPPYHRGPRPLHLVVIRHRPFPLHASRNVPPLGSEPDGHRCVC